jgi:hypothetical protein
MNPTETVNGHGPSGAKTEPKNGSKISNVVCFKPMNISSKKPARHNAARTAKADQSESGRTDSQKTQAASWHHWPRLADWDSGRNAAYAGMATIVQDDSLAQLLCLSLAESERDALRGASLRGQAMRACRGFWKGGPAPYGYVMNTQGVLVPVRPLAKFVAKVYQLFAKLGSAVAVRDQLKAEGIRHFPVSRVVRGRGNSRPEAVSEKAVERITSNPVYAGFVPAPHQWIPITGETPPDLLVDGRAYFKGRHEGLVSRKTWLKANGIMAQTS